MYANQISTNVIADASPDAATEVIIVSQASVMVDDWSSRVNIDFFVDVTTGADTTALVFTLYRSGVAVGAPRTVPLTADELPVTVTHHWFDSAPKGAHTYSVTIQQTDATTDATITSVNLTAVTGG